MIEGFLDIHLPEPTNPGLQSQVQQSEIRHTKWGSDKPAFEKHQSTQQGHRDRSPKPLFTVKPGGIAGYLCMYNIRTGDVTILNGLYTASLCNTASYVDIKAKTDAYVGFLPANALERLIEKRPIVLLTLAKRLISLLSPLGASGHSSCDSTFTEYTLQCYT